MERMQKGKVCSKCGQYKSLVYFSLDGRGGYRNDCKECASKQQHEIREDMRYCLPEFKTCSRCGRTRPISMFSTDKTKKDMHRSHCKECDKEARRWKKRMRLLNNPASKLY
jgi:recombinational DNA repair protein (RecF pathway)